jgi:hypothetical protein
MLVPTPQLIVGMAPRAPSALLIIAELALRRRHHLQEERWDWVDGIHSGAYALFSLQQ